MAERKLSDEEVSRLPVAIDWQHLDPSYPALHEKLDQTFHGIYSRSAATLAQHIPDHACRVLDIGCGTGISTAAILAAASKGTKIFAIDPSPQMLQLAEERLGRRVRFLQCSAYEFC